jgi:hypothetical protein
MKAVAFIIVAVLLVAPALAIENIGGYYQAAEPSYARYAPYGYDGYGARYGPHDYGYGYPQNGVFICNGGCIQPNVRTTVYWQPNCPQPWASNVRPTTKRSLW